MAEADGRPFIAMEYGDGVSLKERLTGPPMAVSEALKIGVQIADALNEARRKQIVHRTPRAKARIEQQWIPEFSSVEADLGRMELAWLTLAQRDPQRAVQVTASMNNALMRTPVE